MSFVARATQNLARAAAPQLLRAPVRAFPLRAFSAARVVRNDYSKHLLDIVKSEHKIATAVENVLEPEQQEYLKESGFSIAEKKFDSNVELYKQLASGEEVRVYFDIDEVSDISLPAPEMGAEEGAEGEQFEEELDQYESTFANVKVFISKPESNDGLFFNLMLQNSEDELFVDYFNYKPDAGKFVAEAQNGTFLSATEYQGPHFSNLDESLQVAMESYLEKKGIDAELAEFIFSYSEVKEEDAYRELLGNVSKFLGN